MNIVIIGKGKMGALIAKTATDQGITVLGNADTFDPAVLENSLDQVDVILDFSHPNNLDWLLKTIGNRSIALVEGTTGYTDEQKAQLADFANTHPVFFSANYSLGVAILTQLANKVAALLKEEWDIEVVETHHHQKVDAPSGTALALVESLDPDHEFEHVYGRQGAVGKRGKEIGIHALRGGTIAGKHEIHFFGEDEELTLTHNAGSRQIFVNGAIKAAKFMQDKPDGLYGMDDLASLA